MGQYLVISALGQDRPGIVEQLSKVILELGGNIMESRMSILGGEFALMLLVSGRPATIAGLQQQLPELEQHLSLTIISKATQEPIALLLQLAHVRVAAMDHPGIVHKVTEFFSQQQINIKTLETTTSPAPHTGSPMFSLDAELQSSHSIKELELTEKFEEFCAQLGLDGELTTI